MKKMVYSFDEGSKEMKPLLGGKGANLAEMTTIGLPVPFGFCITTEVCNEFIARGHKFPEGMWEEVEEKLAYLEEKTGKKLGDPEDPLLVSVRSGAAISMPGMMDTVLNLGLNRETLKGLIKKTNNPRFGWDCYRRFIQMFGNVVRGMSHARFEKILDNIKHKKGAKVDTDLTTEDLQEVVKAYKQAFEEELGEEFPEEPKEQLKQSIDAVFSSWDNPRAIKYREINKIPHDLGTAVNVQMMAFGNTGDNSGTGVGFTRNPSTGKKELYGEYLLNAQGEDVVAGIRTPHPLKDLEKDLPDIYEELQKVRKILENHYKDMQDFEFTIEEGDLYMLQTRTGKRTAQAAVKIAADMVEEGLIDNEEAVMRVRPDQMDQLLHKHIDPKAEVDPVAQGLPASPGAAVGTAVFSADEAAERGEAGEKVILVGVETTPEDIHGMAAAQGVLTSRGGMTSHAAVVARGMGTPCVCGCETLQVNLDSKQFKVEGTDTKVKEGDTLTIDGSTGNVIIGKVPMVDPEMSGSASKILDWADEIRELGVRANADTPEMASGSREFGAEGIGLCRTERMFNAPERREVVQEMVLASDEKGRRAALEKLKPLQKGDFLEIFKVMEGLPVIVRLLDPPLHEFLPDSEELIYKIQDLYDSKAEQREIDKWQDLLDRVKELREFNPMLGHRGCRLGITYPEIYEMQVSSIMEAATELKKKKVDVKPKIMVPLIGNITEMEFLYDVIKKKADQIVKDSGVDLDYKIGTMIELPRAALTADKIAEKAEFFSFGTNDLTQTTLGFSRDDAEAKFLAPYMEKRILKENPFEVVDLEGVGKLIKIGVDLGRKAKPDLEIGVCGEVGGNPESIQFFHEAGLDYVSCSRFRVPIARLSAAQAVIKEKRGGA